jgi:hypothetical protein
MRGKWGKCCAKTFGYGKLTCRFGQAAAPPAPPAPKVPVQEAPIFGGLGGGLFDKLKAMVGPDESSSSSSSKPSSKPKPDVSEVEYIILCQPQRPHCVDLVVWIETVSVTASLL